MMCDTYPYAKDLTIPSALFLSSVTGVRYFFIKVIFHLNHIVLD